MKYQSLNPAALVRVDTSEQVLFTGDIDGDGRDEIIAQNGSSVSVLAYLVYSDISTAPAWTAADQQQIVTAWTSVGPIAAAAAGAPGWTLAAGHVRGVFDLDGDGDAEVLVFSGNQIGVLGWADGGLQVLWQASGDIPGGWGLNPTDQFYAADIDGDGQQELVILSTADNFVGVVKWDGSQLTRLWQSQGSIPGGWGLNPTDQLYAADIDGDGSDELVVLSSADGYVGVIKWDGAQLNCLWKTNGSIAPTGDNTTAWSYNESLECSPFTANLSGKGPDAVLVAYSARSAVIPSRSLVVLYWDGQELRAAFNQTMTTAPFLGSETTIYVAGDWNGDGADEVLQYSVEQREDSDPTLQQTYLSWSGTGFTTLWQLTDSVPVVSPPGSWGMYQWSRYVSLDIDGDGIEELVCTDLTSASTTLLRVVASGPAVYYSATNVVPPWGVDMIAGGPSTPLTPFTTGQQPDVYAYISGQVDPGCGGDIRSDYTNTNDWSSKVPNFSQVLKSVTNPGNYDPADWDAVYNVLAAEFAAAPVVINLFQNRDDLLTKLRVQQLSDVEEVVAQLKDVDNQPMDGAEGVLIFIAILDAVLWGLAAIPEMGAAWPITLSVGASIIGSLSSFVPGSTTPQMVNEATLVDTLSDQYNSAALMNMQLAVSVLTDEIKLQMIGTLAGGPWTWDATTTPKLVAASQNPNRLSFYQILTPTYFSVLVWPPGEDEPGFYSGGIYGGQWYSLANVPSDVWQVQNTNAGDVVRLLAQGTSNIFDGLVYPGSGMMTELSSLGVALSDVLNDDGAWSVPIIDLTPQDITS